MKNQRVMATDGEGSIGLNLARELAEQNEVTIPDDFMSSMEAIKEL